MRESLRRLWRRPSPPVPVETARAHAADVRAFVESTRVYGEVDAARLRQAYPDLCAQIARSAEQALAHRFNLLGSGPHRPVDPDRAARGSYVPIDWTLDPVSGGRFPNLQPSKGCDIAAIRPPASDIKRPWELARGYHWVTLGQAFMLGGDRRYADELFDQCDDFMEANPVGRGIHWTCTMDVAIRAANLTAGLELARACGAEEARWSRALGALLAHGHFIRAHLENHYEVTSNHFLSNVAGLMVLGRAFANREDGRAWFDFAASAMEREIEIQVLEDGADFESSIPYHRLVTELFFSGLRIADVAGAPLSQGYRERLRGMHAFMAAVLRPDGLMPQVGDADDGRLHVFRGHDVQVPQDPRHLFGPAAAAFDEPSWRAVAGPGGGWDAAWWGLASPDVSFAPPPIDAFFPQAGIAVHRNGEGRFLLVTNGAVGTRGFGNHKHNDLLSFEYHTGGQPLIVDPGSFVYTSDPDARNLLRGVASHSTMAVEGMEPNELKPEWLFRMFERAEPEHLEYRASEGQFLYSGRHRGYASAGLVVRRTFTLADGILTIDDVAESVPGEDQPLVWRFQLAPGVRAELTPGGVDLSRGRPQVRIEVPPDLHASIQPGWYSPSYGVRAQTSQVVFTGRCGTSRPAEWRFRLVRAG